ncbi:MAG: signal recognition particle-docking protein FtsY [Candidatus Micrarchaeaceae archaeon]
MFDILKKGLRKAIKSLSREEKEKSAEVSISTKLKSKISEKVKLNEKDIERFGEELKKSLIEADTSYEVAEEVEEELKREIERKEFDSKNIEEQVWNSLKEELKKKFLEKEGRDILDEIKAKQGEYVILFVGPNGSGKTTTIAKLAKLLKDKGISSVIAACDTFRAAAIEQVLQHAEKIGVEVVRSKYGADPASVAYDAIAHAKAKGIKVVLIDTAGRQETNRNLIEEMRKISRVAKPDIKIFVGESISGNAIVEQIKAFNEAIGVDGVILTKMDCDSKGGATLSILASSPSPILFIGNGESYDAIKKYDPNEVIGYIFSSPLP